jgi:acyl carrier protein
LSQDHVADRTRAFIRESFLYARPDFPLDDDADLLAAGIIDSMGVMELIEFLDREFQVEVDDDDITEENLGTVSAIARYVAGRNRLIGVGDA